MTAGTNDESPKAKIIKISIRTEQSVETAFGVISIGFIIINDLLWCFTGKKVFVNKTT